MGSFPDTGLTVENKRTKRFCQEDFCWAGSVKFAVGLSGGLFGEIPSPPGVPKECGACKCKQCNLVKVSGTAKIGLNVAHTVACDKATGQIGHNGLKIDAQFLLLEGQTFEVSLTEAFVLVPAGPLGSPFSYELPL